MCKVMLIIVERYSKTRRNLAVPILLWNVTRVLNAAFPLIFFAGMLKESTQMRVNAKRKFQIIILGVFIFKFVFIFDFCTADFIISV